MVQKPLAVTYPFRLTCKFTRGFEFPLNKADSKLADGEGKHEPERRRRGVTSFQFN